jgi:hypothetical protein
MDDYELAIQTYDKILSMSKHGNNSYCFAYEILEFKGTAYFHLEEFEKRASKKQSHSRTMKISHHTKWETFTSYLQKPTKN